jgi:2'-5' RNA ligase
MTENTALINKSVTKDDYTTVSSDGGVVSLFVPFFSWTQQDNLTLPPEAPPYWTQQRDVVLRATIHNEAMWAGAVGIAIAQMASLAWEVQSEIPLRANRAQDILLQADGHRVGWVGFLSKQLRDYLLTDNGQFAEIVRATSSVGSKIVGLKHLDSLRCTRTGDPERPVVYRDRRGRMHVLRDYQVLMLSDMPDPSDTYFGVGTCAASRAYAAIYKLNRIEWYLREKVGGLHPLAIHIVNGILTKQIEDAVGAAQQQQISKGAASYMGAVIMGTPKETPPDLVTIPLAELPDRFNRKEEFDIAVLTYANALGLDIQDLQPLTGQALGTGAQSQVLDDKSRGKGLSSWRQSWTHALNEYVLDEMTTFAFVEKDYRDQERATAVQKAHADVAGMRIDKGITTPAQELQLLVDYDDLPKEFLPKDETPGDSLSDTDKPEAEEAQQEGAAAAEPSEENAKPGEKPEAEKPAGEEKGEWGKKEAQGDVDKSVMVALFIPGDVAEQIAVKGGNPASDLHITLAYLGDEATDTLDRAKVEAVIAHLAEHHPAVTGVINGRGLFEVGEGTRAHFLTYDAPTLPGLRQAIIDALKESGFAPVENHGFVPHITLTYDKNERGPKVELPKGEMKVPALTLAWGNERSHFPFQGERLKASDESLEEAGELLARVMAGARKRAKKEAVYA